MKIKHLRTPACQSGKQQGQGLVEYAMIMVLIAVVVVVVLALMGPAVGNIYSQVTAALQNFGFSGAAERTGGGNGNDVILTVNATRQVSLSMRDQQSGQTRTASCSSTCTVTFTGVGDAGSAIEVSSDGKTVAVSYPAKH